MFTTYKQLFSDLKEWGEFVMASPMNRHDTRQIDCLAAMGFITVREQDNHIVLSLKPRKNNTVVLAHPNGIAQLPHTVTGHTGEYTIIEHPVFQKPIYRKVSWQPKHGWVAA